MRALGQNRFKLGVFAVNVGGGLTQTLAPERWDASWDNNLAVARMVEACGFEFMLPLTKWIPSGGKAPDDGFTLEAFTWASAMLVSTRRMTIFGTISVPHTSPIYAAKAIATCDHIGTGRFALNMVTGGRDRDNKLFGAPIRTQNERYAYIGEWITILKRIWQGGAPFDFAGRYFQLEGVESKPGPFGGDTPLLVLASRSPPGVELALRHTDIYFTRIRDLAQLAPELKGVRARAADKPFSIFCSGHVICRRTKAETRDYYDHIVRQNADRDALTYMMKEMQGGTMPPELAERVISGGGTYRIMGDPDEVAAHIKQLHDAGIEGAALAFVNYLDDIPIFRDEVLPRLERLGLRGS